MKVLIVSMLLASACGGASVTTVAQTPTAMTPRLPVVAPSGSLDDADRWRLTNSNADEQDSIQAWREARAYPPETPPRQVLVPLPPGGEQPSPRPAAPDRL